MHALIKSSFYIAFIIAMLVMGSHMFFKPNGNKFYKIFGLMTLVLGIGEAFYLIPRVIALFSSNLEPNQAFLESGKLISSISIVLVFALLFKIWQLRYHITGSKWLTGTMFILTISSIIFNLTLQNSSLVVIRILPFVIIGMITIRLFYKESHKIQDKYFKYMWFVVTLSFLFYIPIELFEKSYGFVVILMLPKTIMYIWIISMGYHSFKKELM